MSAQFSPLEALERRSNRLHNRLLSYPAAKKFFKRSTLLASDLRNRSAKLLAGAGLVGSLLVNPAGAPPPPLNTPSLQTGTLASADLSNQLSSLLQPITPHTPTKLSSDQATQIENAIREVTGINAKAVLDGQELNDQVGFIGYEQHLRRYPGDDIQNHDDEQVAGVAPGLGAWGYFAKSRQEFTTQDYLREKWYSVAQTLYLPEWNTDFAHLRDWYKYRKVLVVNPANGSAVVTDIADSGPSFWTGKQFGGSPEVMKALNLHLGPRKGLVIFLFIDDPNNLIPLGPIDKKFMPLVAQA